MTEKPEHYSEKGCEPLKSDDVVDVTLRKRHCYLAC